MIHSEEFLAIVNDAMSRVREVSVDETQERMKHGAVLIDVREDNEFDAAHAAGTRHMGRGIIERDIGQGRMSGSTSSSRPRVTTTSLPFSATTAATASMTCGLISSGSGCIV